MVGIAISDHGVAIGHGKLVAGEFTILKLEFAPVSGSDIQAYVKGWVAQNKLKNADCHYVLNQNEYELELIESPPVADDELLEAVRWRLKDLISNPIEETAIDIFPLPEDAYRGRMKMLYVVAVKKQTIEEKLAFIRHCGLDPKVIDIEELAIRNISLYLPDMEQGTIALLGMKENHGHILMFSHEDMYLTRSIEMGYSSFASGVNVESTEHLVMVERFVLDVQRSLDYYESQLGKGIASKVYLLPAEMEQLDIRTPLEESISPKVFQLDCCEFLPFAKALSPDMTQQAYCLPVIGAVLRRVA